MSSWLLSILTEKSRGRLLHSNPVLGAGSPDADPLRYPQHGAAAALLQPAQPGVQQQGQLSLGHGPPPQSHRFLLPQPQGRTQTGEPKGVLESSSAEHRGNGGERLPRGPNQDVRAEHQHRANHSWKTSTCTFKNNMGIYICKIICIYTVYFTSLWEATVFNFICIYGAALLGFNISCDSFETEWNSVPFLCHVT